MNIGTLSRCASRCTTQMCRAEREQRRCLSSANAAATSMSSLASAALPAAQYLTMKERLKKTKVAPDVWQYLSARIIGKPKNNWQRRHMWFNARYKNFAPIFLDQLKPRMVHWKSVIDAKDLPLPRLPEVKIKLSHHVGSHHCFRSGCICWSI